MIVYVLYINWSFKLKKNVTIQPFTCFSDHKPLLLALSFTASKARSYSKPLYESCIRAPRRYKISPDSHAAFRLSMTEPEIETLTAEILDRDYSSDQQSTYKLNQDVTEHIQKLSDKCLQKTKYPNLQK